MSLMTLKMHAILKNKGDTNKGKIEHQKGYLIRQHKAQLNNYIKEGREAQPDLKHVKLKSMKGER